MARTHARAHTLLCSLAGWPCPLVSAGTGESIESIVAGTSVLTWVAGTLIDILVTVHPSPARTTGTQIPCGSRHTLSVDTWIVGLADIAALGASCWAVAISCVVWGTGAYWEGGAWSGRAGSKGVAPSIVIGTDVSLSAGSPISFIAWRTGSTVEGAHGIETLDHGSSGASSVISGTLIHIQTAVAVALPSSRTGAAVEGALGVVTGHRGVGGARLLGKATLIHV